jgi:hypothetical protein
MMTAQADYPTPRTMIEAFMAQGNGSNPTQLPVNH